MIGGWGVGEWGWSGGGGGSGGWGGGGAGWGGGGIPRQNGPPVALPPAPVPKPGDSGGFWRGAREIPSLG